jgi:MFS superfamily sulfate permease-like transporter
MTTDQPHPIRHQRTHGLRRWVPGISLLGSLNRGHLAKDLGAGLPVISGLCATIVPHLVYALFGPSRILVLGPDSALTALIAATVIPLSGGDSLRAAQLAATLAIIAGMFAIIAGLARFGVVTDLLSTPIRYGYMNGIALTLLVSQLPEILGFPARGCDLFNRSAAS